MVGLTRSEAGSRGRFLQLTDADVAQIQARMSADEAQANASASRAVYETSAQATSAAARASTEPSDAHGHIDHATSRVVALSRQEAAVLGTTASFDDVASDALSRLGDNAQSRDLAASLLEGPVWGLDGGSTGAAMTGIAAQDPGIVSHHGSVNSAHADFLLGRALQTHGF